MTKNEPETIEAEVIEETPERPAAGLAVSTAPHALSNLHGTTDPKQMIEIATAQADALAEVVESRGLYVNIRNKRHVTVEGWTTLGAMVGVFPILRHVRELPTPEGFVVKRTINKGKPTEEVLETPLEPGKTFGFVALCEARTMAGDVVGSAETECTRAESMWKDRDDHALRSMAQTRATSKSLRIPLGFIMQLAGFNPTPEEEMPSGGSRIPNVPNMHQLPEGWEAGPWAKQTILVLVGGDMEKAKELWTELAAIHQPGDPIHQAEAEAIVADAHERTTVEEDADWGWSPYS